MCSSDLEANAVPEQMLRGAALEDLKNPVIPGSTGPARAITENPAGLFGEGR